MRSLLLTLGHNSSAILIEDGVVKWGYENERVSLTKSDSRFPYEAMTYHTNSTPPDMVYATHWAPDGALRSMGEKYWKPETFDGIPIRTLSPERTHHDAHMAGAMAYAGSEFPRQGSIGLVVDGFGIFGEHFSVYDLNGATPRLLRRYHGYGTSLGLWYQYATAFMGMKMHEDEYKLLGYEAHVTLEERAKCFQLARSTADEWLDTLEVSPYTSEYDPVYNLTALPATRDFIFKRLTSVCKELNIDDPSSYHGRVVLAKYVQLVLELVVVTVAMRYKPTNLVLSGGVFYNVKLNLQLLNRITGFLCVYPLAGDQGNALGLYAMDSPEFEIRSLCIGERVLRPVGTVPNMVVTDENTGMGIVYDELNRQGYVNLVRGPMEFGPRALCNTSTLALPLKTVVEQINHTNDRNTVMPMAPVMMSSMYRDLYKNADRLWRSGHHMVCAMEHRSNDVAEHMEGAAHRYSWPTVHYTGRPQIVDPADSALQSLLTGFTTPLINTSFNFHGMPIALGMESVIRNHMMQYQRNPHIKTVVIRNDK